MNTIRALRDTLHTDTVLMAALLNDTTRLDVRFEGGVNTKPGNRITMHQATANPVLDIGHDVAVINFHVYGTSESAASDTAYALIGALYRVRQVPEGNPLRGVSDVTGPSWLPIGDQALYVVTCVATARITQIA